MITIPRNTDTSIRIPIRTENEPTENIERIGVSVTIAAKMLDVCERSIWKLAKAGAIQQVRIGTRCIFSVQSLRNYVDGKNEPCNTVENCNESQEKKE